MKKVDLLSTKLILDTISFVPIIIAGIICVYNVISRNQRGFVYLFIVCATFSAQGILSLMNANITAININYSLLRPYFMILLFIAVILHIDSVSRESIDPWKLIIAAFLFSAGIFSGITYVTYFGFIFGLVFWVYFGIRVYANSPKELKYYAGLNLVGIIMVANGYSMAPGLGLFPVSDSVAPILIGWGFIPMMVAYWYKPKLVNVMPFKVSRLMVLSTDTGVGIFTYSWSKADEAVVADLFSSMISGIGSILKEAVQKGEVQTVKLEEGLLIIKRNEKYPLAFVLVANKSSWALKNSLNAFTKMFVKKFESALEDDMSEVSRFSPAIDLVHDAFPFAEKVKHDSPDNKNINKPQVGMSP